jgi:hypothetical protein
VGEKVRVMVGEKGRVQGGKRGKGYGWEKVGMVKCGVKWEVMDGENGGKVKGGERVRVMGVKKEKS